jgi:hypothetical protein
MGCLVRSLCYGKIRASEAPGSAVLTTQTYASSESDGPNALQAEPRAHICLLDSNSSIECMHLNHFRRSAIAGTCMYHTIHGIFVTMLAEVDSRYATYSRTVFCHDTAVLGEPREVVQMHIPGIPLPLHSPSVQ